MTRYQVQPQRDQKRDEPGEDTWFVDCDDANAEIFAVIDTQLDEIVHDCLTRAEAEEDAARLEAAPEPESDSFCRDAERRQLGGER